MEDTGQQEDAVRYSAGEKPTVDFLRYAIDRLESRVGLVDNKASILIAVIAGLTAAITFVSDRVLWAEGARHGLKPWSYAFLTVSLLWLLAVIFLLLRTVRPTRHALGLRARLKSYKRETYSLLWFAPDFLVHRGPRQKQTSKYRQALEALPQTVKADLVHTHFALSQLLARKYRYYRWAVWLLKMWLVFLWLAIVGFAIAWQNLPEKPVAITQRGATAMPTTMPAEQWGWWMLLQYVKTFLLFVVAVGALCGLYRLLKPMADAWASEHDASAGVPGGDRPERARADEQQATVTEDGHGEAR